MANMWGTDPRLASGRGQHMKAQGAQTREQVRKLIYANPFLNRTQIAEKLGVSYECVKMHMSALKKEAFKNEARD